MEYAFDAPFSDVFRCDGDVDFHDYYYISPFETDESSLLYRVHRTGTESQLPKVFDVERTAAGSCCQILCILSGRGYLTFADRTYELRRNQLVMIPSHEPHRYWCDEKEPMGLVWIEFYGANAEQMLRSLIDLYGPVMQGSLFPDICAQICLIQQRLMVNSYYQPSLELYQVLLAMMEANEAAYSLKLTEDGGTNFLLMEAYINAHLSQKITNTELANVCGLSVQHFLKCFKEHYHQTPQQYILYQKIQKARYSLVKTSLSVDSIAESLGFCNTSHFIRRFSDVMGISPLRYRKLQKKTRDAFPTIPETEGAPRASTVPPATAEQTEPKSQK